MMNLVDSFSFLSIVKVLATLRAKDAVLRHRGEFAQRFFEEKLTESCCHGWSEALNRLLPPRRQWSRPKQRQRGGIGTPKDRILRDSIYRKVQGIYAAGELESVEWGRCLQSFVKEVQQRISAAGLTFQAPVLWIRKKSRSDKGRTGNRYAGSSREIGRCWLAAFRNVWFSPTALHQLKYVDKKLMSLISMSLSGLGLRFSRAHIGRFLSHVATARSLNKRIRKDDVSFSLEQVSCNEELREELSVKYPKSERVMFLKEDYYRAEEDY